MKNRGRLIIILLSISVFFISCKKDDGIAAAKKLSQEDLTAISQAPFDSTLVASFFEKHPKLKTYEPQVRALYRKHQWHYIWYDDKGVNELADLLYSKINTIEDEGVKVTFSSL